MRMRGMKKEDVQVRVGDFETAADQRAVDQDRCDFLQFCLSLWVGIFEIVGAWERLDTLEEALDQW